MKTLNILTASFLGLMSLNAYSATIDSGEYQWNTDDTAGSAKWGTHGTSTTELDDESGGAKYDIAFLGINISGDEFKFGAQGGSILNGQQAAISNGHGLFLSDFAIGINTSSDPTTNASEFGYAIRLLGVNDTDGTAQFQLLGGGAWEAVNIYNDAYGEKHKSVTYKMTGTGTEVLHTFEGEWTAGTGLNNVLEGSFSLGLLAAYTTGDALSTYLTMTCVNDEAFVQSAVPVPAALFMFAPALAGFMGLRRRLKATA